MWDVKVHLVAIPNHVATSHLHPPKRLQPSSCLPHAVGGNSDVSSWMRTTRATGVADRGRAPARLQRHPAPLTGRLKARFVTILTRSPLQHRPALHAGMTGNVSTIIRRQSAFSRGWGPRLDPRPRRRSLPMPHRGVFYVHDGKYKNRHRYYPASLHPLIVNRARGGAYRDEI